MITGKLPFDGETFAVISVKILTEKIPVNKELTKNIYKCLQICTEKQQNKRYKSVEELKNKLNKKEEKDSIIKIVKKINTKYYYMTIIALLTMIIIFMTFEGEKKTDNNEKKEEVVEELKEEKNFAQKSGTCIVNGANGKKYKFLNHNLGADPTADPLKPDRKLNGAYYQWGRKDAVAYAPTESDDDPGIVGTWDDTDAHDDAWSDYRKTANDPCPEGYRVPTSAEWDEVIENNTWTAVGNWDDWDDWGIKNNYSAGYKIKPDGSNTAMFLPASGSRNSSNGALNYRGSLGGYWCSSQDGTGDGYNMDFGSSPVYGGSRYTRSYGFSVRCLAE